MIVDKERDINPPEFKDEFEPDWDSLNDEQWLREREVHDE